MFARWKKSNNIAKYCLAASCERDENSNTTPMNTSTNQTQLSTRMKYAQYVRKHSKGASINNSISGGIKTSGGIFNILSTRNDKCKMYLPDFIPEEIVYVDTTLYPPYLGPPDLSANFYDSRKSYPPEKGKPPDLTSSFYDPNAQYPPVLFSAPPDLSKISFNFPPTTFGPPDLTSSFMDNSKKKHYSKLCVARFYTNCDD